jgi:hypothetical protein
MYEEKLNSSSIEETKYFSEDNNEDVEEVANDELQINKGNLVFTPSSLSHVLLARLSLNRREEKG